jgi:threonine aldolase
LLWDFAFATGNMMTHQLAIDQHHTVDLRSDVVSQPTEAMWHAMREAPLGLASAGEDPSLRQLEGYAAELAGKEAALYMPTGTMANLVALMTHTNRGDQVIMESSSHTLWSEEWSFASICGVLARGIDGAHGYMEPETVRGVIRDKRFSHRPHTSLICLENTHNMAGGTILTPTQIQSIKAVAEDYGIAIHLDGARIFNACVALDKPLRAFTDDVDSVVMNLNKGLSAPEGALLCGSNRFIEQVRLNLKQLGGGSLHKAGIFAAAGLVALQTMIPALADDHRRAQLLAHELSKLNGVRIDLSTVQTNIVMAAIDEAVVPAELLIQQMKEQGIRATLYKANVIRFVTHREVTDEGICRVIQVIRDIVS